MRTEPFEFTGAAGQPLAGRIDRPDGPAHAYALFAHCFTCTKDSLAAVRISRALAGRGIAVLRFDFTGLGQSGGSFGEDGFSSDVRDVVAAAHAMAAADMAPRLLVGHSLGGAAVLAAALELPSVTAVASVAAPFDVEHLKGQFGASLERILADGEAQVDLGGRPFTVRKSFVEDLKQHDQGARIAALRRPLLILHSPRDNSVGVENATAIFQSAKHPKSFVSLDDADHLLTRQSDADFVADMIAAWAARYIGRPAVLPKHQGSGVVAELTGAGRFQTRLTSGAGSLMADEPVEVGGLRSGPTPYELLSGALAACTAMTLRMYADHKSIALPKLRVEVAHSKLAGTPSRDCFSRRIDLGDGLDGETQKRLIEIADRCPVHRTLEAGADVVTSQTGGSMPEEPPAQHMRDMEEAGA